MDYSSLPGGVGGAATAIAPIAHRLSLYLQRRSKKIEMQSILKDALGAIDELSEAQSELAKVGEEYAREVVSVRIPVELGPADRLYLLSVRWMGANAKIILSLVKLAQQANSFAKLSTIMDDLKVLDRPAYELVRLLERSYREGKLDLTDFPTYIAVFGPKDMDKVVEGVQEEMEQFMPKLERVIETLPEPRRIRLPTLRRSLEELTQANKNIATTQESIIQALLARAPPWMKSMVEIYEKAAQKAIQLAMRRANRYPPRKPTRQSLRWPRTG